MRELTTYELEKWGKGYDFEAPEFLGYGDETGEYYDAFVNAHHAALAHGNDELVKMLQVEILDAYYNDIFWHLTDGEGYHENVVLPPLEEVEAEIRETGSYKVFSYGSEQWTADTFRVLDWAVEKGAAMKEEVLAEREIERLQKRLESLQTPRKLALGKALLEEDRKEFG